MNDASTTTVNIEVLRGEDRLTEAHDLFLTSMVGSPRSFRVGPDHITETLEAGRTLGAFVDGQLVGTVDSATSSLTVPGGARVPHAAVTGVGVLPTHTRRGVVTSLIRHQLEDAVNRGEVLATLRASEGTIYERFGYRVASSSVSAEIDTRRARLRTTVPAGSGTRIVAMDHSGGPQHHHDLLRRIYDGNRSQRPGTIDRPGTWWSAIGLAYRSRTEPRYVAVHGPAGAETGFVRYRPIDTGEWFTSSARTVVVDDFFAPTPQAQAGLIRFLLQLDLVDRIVFSTLPIDTDVPLLLQDQRACSVTYMGDETWLRLLDVFGALSARVYDGEGTVVIGVSDGVLAHNAGIYRITSDATGAHRVEKTEDAPQLEVDVATLAAVFLGGYRWKQVAAAGSVVVHDADALDTADRLFRTDDAPYAGISF